MAIQIRTIRQKDNLPVAQMIRGVFDEYKAATEGTVYTDPTTDKLFELFQVSDAVLFVAEKEGEIHGCCGIFPTLGLPKKCLELVKFYVSNDIRGTGIGRQLYQHCEQKAKEMDYTQLYIESMDDFRDAVRIYEKIGFQILDQPMGTSGHFGCKIWMSKDI